jgi:pilus assembly protein CpaD
MTGSARKDMKTMTRLKIAAALIVAGFGSSGCVHDLYDSHDGALSPVSNPTLSSVNQPVVTRTDYVLDVNAAGGIGADELARLDNWFQSIELGYSDRVFVEGQYQDPQARQDVARLLADYGLFLADGAPITAGTPQGGQARIIVSRSVASVPGCPIWEDPQIGQSSRTSTNYGCAINSNLARMIADPNDLVLGQKGALPRNGDTTAKAVKAFRDRTPLGASGNVQ